MSPAVAAAVTTGLEVLLAGDESRKLRGKRLGLIAHAASVDSALQSTIHRMASTSGLRLEALFGPEHGFDSGAQDMVPVSGAREERTGLRVHSLYGGSLESLSPSFEMLEGLDVLVCDLQDVGARYYTFAATAALALEAFAPRGGRLVVLDRPNPIGGDVVEGPGIEPSMRSFVGHIEVPIRHGLTIGELLLVHARQRGLEGAVEIVPMRGWKRTMSFEQTGLPWVPPSPNMPTLDTAYVYPGTCLIEATNLSEGRGTTRPFEWIGAPFLDSEQLAKALDAEDLPGAAFRPHRFVPAFHKWAARPCGGVAIHVTDRRTFRPVRTGIALLAAARRLAPGEFAWRTEPYEFVSDRPAIDLLMGSTNVREAIEAGAGAGEIVRDWEECEAGWLESRTSRLLYD